MPHNQPIPPDLPDDVVLSVRHVSKKFCRNLRRSMWYGIQDLAGNLLGKKGKGIATTPILPNTPTPIHAPPLRPSEFWALRDISFDLRRGECLGLIGRNGSGKTTLLRLIAGIFPPDAGEITIRGRVGALIALGAGFHPHMTGRENVYLNGSILGLSKKEIDAQYDEIVNFAEIGDFIDAPVATYSSGMRVRLGFAVAIHVKPELLLIDEILAVGDEGFRSKCYNAISDIMSKAAVVFVSHQMPAVSRICQRVIVLKDGFVAFEGDVPRGIEVYGDIFSDDGQKSQTLGTGEAKIANLELRQAGMINPEKFQYGQALTIAFDVSVDLKYDEFLISISFMNREGQLVAQLHSGCNQYHLRNTGKIMRIEIDILNVTFNPGAYTLSMVVYDFKNVRFLSWLYAARRFVVVGKFTGSAPNQLIGKWSNK